jgi:predicted ATPase/DNA-binding SARP family transcriptional activator/Tfp pilus assembly protein PilF
MQFRLLGPLEVEDDGRPLVLGSAKQRALLAILLLHANEVVSRDRLIDELWGEQPPASAPHSVEVYVSRLRKTLQASGGEQLLVTRAGGYLLLLEPDQLDVTCFERLLEEGRRALAAGNYERASERFADALALWRGPALGDLSERFAVAAAARLEEGRVSALEQRLEADLDLARHRQLVGELETLVAEHPYRERLRAQLMLALYRCGRQAEALRAYQHARRTLAGELGLEPSHELKELEQAILRQDVSLSPLAPRPGPSTRLPAQLTPFLGRTLELAEIVALLQRADSRLLTLTGAGGSGKTRLALRAAAEAAADYPDGVSWVPLASLRDPALVPASIAQALAIQDERELADRIGKRRLLLLLDNCEHLLAAAPALAQLLVACPNLKLLATSREPLHLAGEREYLVSTLREQEAVALFRQRAQAAEPEEAVLAICRRLDCLPLAVELAAARTKLLPPQALLQRLERRLPLLTGGPRDAPERQRTLEATIAWSYDLLRESERRLFARLSVFAGGFTLEAAEQGCDGDLNTLQALADKNLLRHDRERFGMLETIREYAQELLDRSEDREEMRRRHAEHYLEIAEAAEAASYGEDLSRGDWLERLVPELPNLRAAFEWALARGEVTIALRLVGSAWIAWSFGASLSEGRRLMSRALEHSRGADSLERVKVLLGAAAFAGEQGDVNWGEELLAEALKRTTAIDNPKWLARCKHHMGLIALQAGNTKRAQSLYADSRRLADEGGSDYDRAKARFLGAFIAGELGDFERAQALLEQGISLVQRLGIPRALWNGQLINLGWFAMQQGDYARARAALERYIEEATFSNSVGIANAHGNLGHVALHEGNRDSAASSFTKSLSYARETGANRTIVEALYGLAAVSAIDGETEKAVHLWAAADAILEQMGGSSTGPERFITERYLEPLRTLEGEAFWAQAWTDSGSLTIGEAVAYALEPMPDRLQSR